MLEVQGIKRPEETIRKPVGSTPSKKARKAQYTSNLNLNNLIFDCVETLLCSRAISGDGCLRFLDDPDDNGPMTLTVDVVVVVVFAKKLPLPPPNHYPPTPAYNTLPPAAELGKHSSYYNLRSQQCIIEKEIYVIWELMISNV